MYLRMPAIKSTDPIPQEALAIRAKEILHPESCRQLQNVQRRERIYFRYCCDWKLRCDIVEAHKFANLTDTINAIGTQNLMPRKKS